MNKMQNCRLCRASPSVDGDKASVLLRAFDGTVRRRSDDGVVLVATYDL